MQSIIASLKLETDRDALAARRMAWRVAELLGFDDSTRIFIASAVSSVAARSLALAAGSSVEFGIAGNGSQTMTVRIGYPAGSHDFEAERQLVDILEIETGSRAAVLLEKRLPEGGANQDCVSQIASTLAGEPAGSLLEEIAWQDRQWMAARGQLAQVNQELEDTNAGVMALYTELDELTKQLRQVSEMKSRFLSHLSHEVRTPVNSIKALSTILLRRLDGPLTAEQDKQVTFIREAAEQLSNLVNDELDMAKVEAGKITVHVGEFQIGQIFGALRGMFKPLQQNPDVSLIFEEPYDVPMLRSDEGKVGQILRNLVSNALKFTPAGEIRVSARAHADKRSVALTVADTGIGIGMADQKRIFREFFQAESAISRSRDGAGIGLHLSRQLAELLGGSLSVKSELHSGSVFTATLPLVCPQAEEKQPDVGSALPILIIDDDRLSRYVLRQTIGETDCRILEAESGSQGLWLARSDKPRLIFLDLIMPDLDGYQVLRELKADASTRDIPVVILTSMPAASVRSSELAGDAASVLFKDGLSHEALLGIIHECEGAGSGGRASC